jgi:hypothetical protein
MSKIKGKHLCGKSSTIIPGSYKKADDGTGLLKEQVPNFYQHNNEECIYAKHNNNAMIRLGRDRYDQKSNVDPSLKSTQAKTPTIRQADSGFAAFQGAGAIDLVVGRGAPWPFASSGGLMSENMPPLYTTRVVDTPTGKIPELENGVPELKQNHPMIFMDAARIYISQMCNPDKYFNLKNPTTSGTIDKNPCSAIVIKGDKIRMHARRDIKIVAGLDRGDKRAAKIDSNGYPIRDDTGRIYLMKNEQATCTPAVRGDKMVMLAEKILSTQRNIIVMLNNIVVNSMKLNSVLGTSFYVSPSGPTAVNPVCAAATVFDTLASVNEIFNQYFEGFYNISMNQMESCTPAGADSILSKNVFIS